MARWTATLLLVAFITLIQGTYGELVHYPPGRALFRNCTDQHVPQPGNTYVCLDTQHYP